MWRGATASLPVNLAMHELAMASSPEFHNVPAAHQVGCAKMNLPTSSISTLLNFGQFRCASFQVLSNSIVPRPPQFGRLCNQATPIMAKDWDQHKREITALYITQGKSLDDVRRIMKGRHGFDAS
jgi:hypothetical protein